MYTGTDADAGAGALDAERGGVDAGGIYAARRAETTIQFFRADCSARDSDNSPVANVDQMNSHSQNSMYCFIWSTFGK